MNDLTTDKFGEIPGSIESRIAFLLDLTTKGTMSRPEHIIRKDTRYGTWQYMDEAPDTLTLSLIRTCGLYVLGPLRFFDADDPACDWIELDEGLELIDCSECCQVKTRAHTCERDVPPTITLPPNPYDHSEAR